MGHSKTSDNKLPWENSLPIPYTIIVAIMIVNTTFSNLLLGIKNPPVITNNTCVVHYHPEGLCISNLYQS